MLQLRMSFGDKLDGGSWLIGRMEDGGADGQPFLREPDRDFDCSPK